MATNKPRVMFAAEPEMLERIQKVMDREPVYENRRSVFIRHAIVQQLRRYEAQFKNDKPQQDAA